MDKQFFIFGPQKSGTTLLTTILSQNTEIRVATDSVFLNIFIAWINDKAVDFNVNPNAGDINQYLLGNSIHPDILNHKPAFDDVKWFISAMYQRYFSVSTQRLSQLLKMNKQSGKEDFLRSEELIPYEHGQNIDPAALLTIAKSGGTWQALFNEVIKQIADVAYANQPVASNVLYGEKTPGHIRFASIIDNAYSDSPFLFVIRNPIANIASYYKRDNSGFGIGHKGNLDQALKSYSNYIDPFIKYYQAKPERFEIIRYEDLVADPNSVMQRLSVVLGKSFEQVEDELKPTIKQTYVGNKIDPAREQAAYDILAEPQKAIIMQRYNFIFKTFYPDFTL